jgi:hypothetical protein
MSELVELSRTIEARRRADFVAGERRDDDEGPLLRCLWREAMDAELASPIETPKDAYAKLWWACYWIGLGADEDLSCRADCCMSVARSAAASSASATSSSCGPVPRTVRTRTVNTRSEPRRASRRLSNGWHARDWCRHTPAGLPGAFVRNWVQRTPADAGDAL